MSINILWFKPMLNNNEKVEKRERSCYHDAICISQRQVIFYKQHRETGCTQDTMDCVPMVCIAWERNKFLEGRTGFEVIIFMVLPLHALASSHPFSLTPFTSFDFLGQAFCLHLLSKCHAPYTPWFFHLIFSIYCFCLFVYLTPNYSSNLNRHITSSVKPV